MESSKATLRRCALPGLQSCSAAACCRRAPRCKAAAAVRICFGDPGATAFHHGCSDAGVRRCSGSRGATAFRREAAVEESKRLAARNEADAAPLLQIVRDMWEEFGFLSYDKLCAELNPDRRASGSGKSIQASRWSLALPAELCDSPAPADVIWSRCDAVRIERERPCVGRS